MTVQAYFATTTDQLEFFALIYLFFLLQSEENSAESSQGERNTPLFLVANKVDLLRLEHNTTSPIVDSLVSSLSHGQKKVDTHYISCTSGAGLQAS